MVMAEVSIFAGPLFLVNERIGFLAPYPFLLIGIGVIPHRHKDFLC